MKQPTMKMMKSRPDMSLPSLGQGPRTMKLVVIESPLSAPTPEERARNRRFAAACMADSLARGEAPYASHLLFDQPGILDDQVPAERTWGMEAGFAWGEKADLVACYWNLGVSRGMEAGLAKARLRGQEVEFRRLPEAWAGK